MPPADRDIKDLVTQARRRTKGRATQIMLDAVREEQARRRSAAAGATAGPAATSAAGKKTDDGQPR